MKIKKQFKIIARHKWILRTTITESFLISDDVVRRFTATICGFRNWKIFEGKANNKKVTDLVFVTVQKIRDRIESGDETIFAEKNEFITKLE